MRQNEDPFSKIQASRLIPTIIEELYRKVGQQVGVSPDNVFRSGQCENMSDELSIALRRKGIKTDVASYLGWDVTVHDFVIFIEDGEDWIADPTWQQFLKEPDPSLPHVLIAKKANVVATLSKLGMPENKHNIWLKATRMNL